MRAAIHRYVNATSLVAIVALMLALSGGAWAAQRYLITSTKQISPKVLKALKGKRGAKGVDGAAGPGGSQGPQGPQGPAGTPGGAGIKGETGAPGPEGKEGKAGKEGKEGKEGKSGFTETLPSGKTETGAWSVKVSKIIGFETALTAISFPIPVGLKEGEVGTAVYLDQEETEEAQPGNPVHGCEGTLARPSAPADTLCVYTMLEANEHPNGSGQISFDFAPGFGASGAFIAFSSDGGTEAEPGQILDFGTWAVTAP
jgi:hypothetical protein